jgi:hypothetical protein
VRSCSGVFQAHGALANPDSWSTSLQESLPRRWISLSRSDWIDFTWTSLYFIDGAHNVLLHFGSLLLSIFVTTVTALLFTNDYIYEGKLYFININFYVLKTQLTHCYAAQQHKNDSTLMRLQI